MSEKRKRQAALVCTDEVWSDFQGLATERGKTLAELLGEIVESEVALRSRDDQATLAEVVEVVKAERSLRALTPRTLIGFGQPVVRVR
jgi:hypothetical protein